jgi:hypothetical protein
MQVTALVSLRDKTRPHDELLRIDHAAELPRWGEDRA